MGNYPGRSTYFLHYLLLKSTGYQPPQLRQTVIDSVSPAFLDDLQKAGKTKEDISIAVVNPKVKKGGSLIYFYFYFFKSTVKRLTPLRLFLARICEDVVGDMQPRAELKFLNERKNKQESLLGEGRGSEGSPPRSPRTQVVFAARA